MFFVLSVCWFVGLFVGWLVGWFVCLFASYLNIGPNFCNIEDSNLIFGMLVYLMVLHILSGERSRSRSSLKVKGQIHGETVFYKHTLFYMQS